MVRDLTILVTGPEMNGEAPSRQSLRERYEELIRSSAEPPDLFEFLAAHPAANPREIADVVLCDITHSWRRGTPCAPQIYFARIPVLARDARLKTEIIDHDFSQHQATGETIGLDSYLMQFSDVPVELADRLRERSGNPTISRTVLTPQPLASGTSSPTHRGRSMPSAPTQLPARIGRYLVKRILGGGRFGTVYEAFDELLHRMVAVKQPHRGSLSDAETDMFATEARHLAQLNHPGIVPVYDFGIAEDGTCYVVTRLIDGETLAAALQQRRFRWQEAAQLLSRVAGALHYAHCHQIVHRDLKPDNILLDRSSQPYVADFGLALNELQQRDGAFAAAGTPAYMSPEQICGEVRYLDGRSDLWSLGVILYELLTGQRPFRGDTVAALTVDILNRDPKPLRLLNAELPVELEQLCLRCLVRERTHRLPTAADLAAGLEQSLAPHTTGSAVMPLPEGFRVVSMTTTEAEDYPLVTCTLMNRTLAPVVMIAVRAEVAEVRARRGGAVSRVLASEMRIDVVLPTEPGDRVTPLLHPVLVGAQDGMSLELRLMCRDAAGQCRSPVQVGDFRCRLVFLTDLSWEASTDEFTLGRSVR
ncbi:MAG: serine/threonine-protein kinase [Planctomycetota bacterium]